MWDQTLSDPNLQFCGLSQHLVNMENVVQDMSVVMELSWKTWNSDLIMFERSKVTRKQEIQQRQTILLSLKQWKTAEFRGE